MTFQYFDTPISPALERLILKYPRLFHGQLPRSFSYVIGGWEDILDRAFAEIDKLLTDEESDDFTIQQIKEKFGGLRLYIAMGDEAGEFPDDWSPSRIKARDEKWTELIPIVKRAEQEAARTCETCGKLGRRRILIDDPEVAPLGWLEVDQAAQQRGPGGWYVTCCDEHARHQRERGEG